MPNPRLSDAMMRQALDYYERFGTSQAAATALGIPRATFEGRLHKARQFLGKTSTDPAKTLETSSAMTGENMTITRIVPKRVKTLADLISACEIDTTEWAVERWVANKWDSAAVLGTPKKRKFVTEELYQVKVWLKPRRPIISAREEIKAMLADAAKKIPPRVKAIRKTAKSGYLLELAIPDLHLGKLAWGKETGGADYDSKIAARLYREAIETLLQRTSGVTFDRIVLVVGNDFLHSDTKQGTTTAGTHLDNDSRFHRTYLVGRRLLCESIERLATVAPVTVVVIPGNHDTLAAFTIGDSLECWFRNTPQVEIRNEPTSRKYYQHGSVMLMWTHGNTGKLQNLPLLMATEQREMFGATVHRECHTGDKHQTRVQEHMGVKVRISPALCAADAWHSEQHFVGNARSAEAYVWHKTDGLVNLAIYTVPEPSR